jgi:uncharacterized protein involved in response to NO
MSSVHSDQKTDSNPIDPYRILFPLGSFLGIIGVIFWLFFQMGWIHFYPRALHGNLMFFGLLWSFIAGFLMTAIPKMTMTPSASFNEISIAVVLIFLQLVINLRNLIDISIYLLLFQNLFLIIFILRRFMIHRKVPFFGFVFLPMAFFQSLIGVALFFHGQFDRSQILLLCGEAFVLNLILGLGSRLIPVISRLPNSLRPDETQGKEALLWPLFTFILLNFGYWLELYGLKDVGLSLRLLGLIIAAIKLFRIFQKPTTWSYVGVGLKIALLMLLVGHLLNYSFLSHSLAGLHLIYIGGFTLITFLIATRVMLAHGNQSLNYEISDRRILILLILLLASACLRFLSGLDISSYLLTASALCFITAISLWSVRFLNILRSK